MKLPRTQKTACVIILVAVGMCVVTSAVLPLISSNPNVSHQSEQHTVVTRAATLVAPQVAPLAPKAIQGPIIPSWCDETGKRPSEIYSEISRRIATDTQPELFRNVTNIKGHLKAIRALLQDQGGCMSAVREKLLGGDTLTRPSYHAFFDLGSRTGDQLHQFQLRFPGAHFFDQFPFEANPAFNAHYIKQPSNVHYHNFAVGTRNGTLTLTNRSVGSSIVDGGNAGAGGISVRVIDFAEFVGKTLLGRIGSASFVLIKMDIEKMEYAVIHRMLLTGTLLLADDLLLECHHTSNKPPSSRATHDIGKEECLELVEVLGRALSTKQRPFTSVLWNNKKTAKAYTKAHGGFYPT